MTDSNRPENMRIYKFFPFTIYNFCVRMSEKFNFKYCSIMFFIYGLNQGLGEGDITILSCYTTNENTLTQHYFIWL